ncbi:MAG: hypothetical protein PHD02_01670 [Bacilli bacterium]|nr:hypothetical protein [Bacilli bacterium]
MKEIYKKLLAFALSLSMLLPTAAYANSKEEKKLLNSSKIYVSYNVYEDEPDTEDSLALVVDKIGTNSVVDTENVESDILKLGEENLEIYKKLGVDFDAYARDLMAEGIKIENGNIIIQSPEDIDLIAEKYKAFMKLFGQYPTMTEIRELANNLNFGDIDNSIIKEMIYEKKLSSPMVEFVGSIEGLMMDLSYDLLNEMSKRGNFTFEVFQNGEKTETSLYPTLLPLIFDQKTRLCAAQAESYIMDYITFTDRNDLGQTYNFFLTKIEQFYRFINGEESSFPYLLSELEPTAQYTFFMFLRLYQNVNVAGDGIIYSPVSMYIFDSSVKEKLYKLINPYLSIGQSEKSNRNF